MRKALDIYIPYLKKAIIPGLVIGSMHSIGKYIKQDGGVNVSLSAFLYWLLSLALAFFCIASLFLLIDRYKADEHKKMSDLIHTKMRYCIVVFVLLLVFLTPSYLSVYPGLFNYDAPEQLSQFMLEQVTEHHPVIHTYLFGQIFYYGYQLFEDMNIALCLYFIVQTIIFSLMLVYIFGFFYEKNVPIIIHCILFLGITMYPPITLHLLCVTKDNYFTLCLVDFLIVNYKFFDKEEKDFSISDRLLWILFLFGTIAFRNNAVYVAILMAPLWFYETIVVKNKKIRSALVMVGIFLAIFLLYKYPFTRMVTVRGIDSREMLSVPVQQLSRVYVYHYDELTEDERQDIEILFSNIDLKTWYNPGISDVPKYYVNKELLGSKKYITLYLELFKRYPKEYVDSFLENNYGFWYMWPELVLTWQNDRGYMYIKSFEPFSIESKNPSLLKYYELYYDSKLVDDNMPWAFVFMPATYLYLCLISFSYALYNKDRKMIFALLFIIILWMTYLLGPVALVRYVLFLYLLVPVELAMIYISNSDAEKLIQKIE